MGRLREHFGKHLLAIRQDRGLTQEQFAELVGISVDFLSLIERGLNAPSFETLERFADRLDVSVSFLFAFDQDVSSAKGRTPAASKRLRRRTR
jgi:transcriptional regulator with XRE-family HTH domain